MMKMVLIQCYPFVFGSDGGGGIEGNAKTLATITYTTVSNMPLTDYEITLDDDYKIIVVNLFSIFSSGSPTIELELETTTLKNKWNFNTYGQRYMSGLIAFDLNVSKKKGEKYIFKYRSYYTSSTAPPYWLSIYGIK